MGLYAPMVAARVRTPQPLNISGDSRRSATAAALSSSTMPVHSRWPMLEASESMGRLPQSRPSAYQQRAGEVGGVDVPLHLAQRDRSLGDPAIGEGDPVPGVPPALVDQAAVGGAPVLDEPVTVAVPVLLDPLQGAVGVRQQRVHLVGIGAP